MGGMNLSINQLVILDTAFTVHLPSLHTPRRDEFAKAITPKILVDRDGNKQTSGHRLVAVHRVRTHDTGQRRDLDTRTRVSDDDNRLPRPLALVPDRNNDVAKEHDNNVRDHSRQSHLRLSYTAVLPRRSCRDPITQRPRCKKPDQRTDNNGKVGEAYSCRAKVVGREREDLRLREVDGQEGGTGPRDDESGEFNDRECEELPGNPEIEEDRAEGMCVGLEDAPLPTAGATSAEVRVPCGGFSEGKAISGR